MDFECIRKGLRNEIKKTGISERMVHIGDRPIFDERFNLIKREDGKWEVFYGERGQKTNPEVYDTEEEASRALIQRIKGKSLPRQKGSLHFFDRLIRKKLTGEIKKTS